jgi:hypothetical protein
MWARYEASITAEVRLRRACEIARTSRCPSVDAGPELTDRDGSWVDRLQVYVRYLESDEETLRVGDDLVRCLGGTTARDYDRSIAGVAHFRKLLARVRASQSRFADRLRLLHAGSAVDTHRGSVKEMAGRKRESDTLMREIELHARIEKNRIETLAQLEAGHCIAAFFEIAIPGMNKRRCEPIAEELRKDRRFKYVLCTQHTAFLETTPNQTSTTGKRR